MTMSQKDYSIRAPKMKERTSWSQLATRASPVVRSRMKCFGIASRKEYFVIGRGFSRAMLVAPRSLESLGLAVRIRTPFSVALVERQQMDCSVEQAARSSVEQFSWQAPLFRRFEKMGRRRLQQRMAIFVIDSCSG